MQIGDEWWSRFEKFSAEDLFLNDLTTKESDKAFGALIIMNLLIIQKLHML